MADVVIRLLRDSSPPGEPSIVTALRDSLSESSVAHSVFWYIVKSLCVAVSSKRSSGRGIVVVASESPPSYFASLQKSTDSLETASPLQVIDCFSDALGWKAKHPEVFSGCSENYVQCPISNLDGLQKQILEGCKNCNRKETGGSSVYVVFDSVSQLIVQNSLGQFMSLLESLQWSREVSGIFLTVHSDLHKKEEMAAFDYAAQVVLTVEPAAIAAGTSPKGREAMGAVRMRQKKRSGKMKETVEVMYEEGDSLKFTNQILPPVEVESLPILSHNTAKFKGREISFNLELSEKEKEDRARVVLPYEHQGEGREIQIYDGRSGEQMGEIHYVRDSDDEQFDSDEDPDDDLDI